MESSESRIAPSPGAASDDSASPSNPQPGGAADRLAFEPVPLRYREDGFTPEKQRAYVEALADCGIAREAAARVGLSEQAINRVRRRSDARSFDRACEAAHVFGARRIRSIAFERAIEGTLKGHYYHGELISQERVYDNRLLTFLYGKVAHLLARDEERSRSICDNWEAHMEALERGLPPPAAGPAGEDEDEAAAVLGREEVWQDEAGRWRTTFPPPRGFEGDEEGVWNCFDWYSRSLTPQEQAAIEARLAEDDYGDPVRARASETARRDRFFGFAGGEVSCSREAETRETSEPSEAVDPDPRPIEYKSVFPPAPCPTSSAGNMRVHAEARRRGETSRFIPARASPPAPAGSRFRAASPEERRKGLPLRVSASPREPDPGRGGT